MHIKIQLEAHPSNIHIPFMTPDALCSKSWKRFISDFHVSPKEDDSFHCNNFKLFVQTMDLMSF